MFLFNVLYWVSLIVSWGGRTYQQDSIWLLWIHWKNNDTKVFTIYDCVFDVSWKQQKNLKYFYKQMSSLNWEEYRPIKALLYSTPHSLQLHEPAVSSVPNHLFNITTDLQLFSYSNKHSLWELNKTMEWNQICTILLYSHTKIIIHLMLPSFASV